MKFLSALKRQAVDNCIILTYNANLVFFEYMLFEPLYAAGCRNTLIVSDPHQYDAALADAPLLRYAGQRYLFMPGRTSPSGAFHPKLVFLTSSDGGKVFLLSGNLTQAGYTRNWEVVTSFEYNVKSPNPIAWLACRWAFDTLLRIVQTSEADELAHQRLERLIGTTAWLRQEPAIAPEANSWLLHNLGTSLFDQVSAQYHRDDGSPVREIVAISPYFDPNARAVEKFLTDFTPQQLSLYTHKDTHGLNPRALRTVLERHTPDFQINHLSLADRALHAKLLLLRTQRGVWLAAGSANLSRPAWLHPAETGNTEMVLLRFESDSTYFDTWLGELTQYASALELDWEAEHPGDARPSLGPETQIQLLSAMVEGDRIVLHLSDSLGATGALNLCLTGEYTYNAEQTNWQQKPDHSLTLQLPHKFLNILEHPTLARVEVLCEPVKLVSNTVLVHNRSALKRFSQPVRRTDRPSISPGMIPQSYEHCAQLLEMLHNLLATNSELLRRHRGRIAALRDTDRDEQKMAVEEEGDYDPEAHFVDERVDAPVTSSGADLYEDFYDRLTYEELLRAALAAVYHPMPEPREPEGAETEDDEKTKKDTVEPPPKPTLDELALRQKMLASIASRFDHLVNNFVQGATDSEYLGEAPPQYLMELFVIITTYLRVVWRDGMLSDTRFVAHTLQLLPAFWGQVGQPGAWQTLRKRVDDAYIEREEERLALSAQTWLHVYIAAEYLDRHNDRRVYDVAAWMRYFTQIRVTPDVLCQLPESIYQRLWRFSLPSNAEFHTASEVIEYLHKVSERYDEETLRTELRRWPGTHADITRTNTGGLIDVQTLQVKMPLTGTDTDPRTNLDRCWNAFRLFLTWPEPKEAASASFFNSNPPEDPNEISSIRIFYRGYRKFLVFAVERVSRKYDPDFEVSDATLDRLNQIKSFDALYALRTD